MLALLDLPVRVFLQPVLAQEVVNAISFEKSGTGFLFTSILIEGKNVKAMIDFGDPGELMLSSSFVQENSIATRQTSSKMLDVNGNEYLLEEGEVRTVTIGDQELSEMTFLETSCRMDYLPSVGDPGEGS